MNLSVEDLIATVAPNDQIATAIRAWFLDNYPYGGWQQIYVTPANPNTR